MHPELMCKERWVELCHHPNALIKTAGQILNILSVVCTQLFVANEIHIYNNKNK